LTKKVFNSKTVAQTGAPYSQAVISEDLIFLSGQVPMDPRTKNLITSDMHLEVKQIMDNISSLLDEMGSSLDNILKVTVFLTDMNDFQAFNEEYKRYFPTDPPARSCVEVGNLPFGARLEMEAIAILPGV
jgi:2-iminobutanoate/2-iminopropanoate deaminase